MRNTLLTLAGVLALVGALGKFYAVPALAQAARAALVRDIDNPALNFVQINRSISLPDGGGASITAQQDFQYSVPAGHRLVIDTLSVGAASLGSSTVTGPFTLYVGGSPTACAITFPSEEELAPPSVLMPLLFAGSGPAFLGNAYANAVRLQTYADAGNCLAGGLQVNSVHGGIVTVIISGHLVSFP
jgi:hypothetical protein